MRTSGNLGRQFSDLLGYILLPLVCLVLPVAWGEKLLTQCADKGWILKARSRRASLLAGKLIFIPDPQAWQSRWRLVELVDTRDCWFYLLGRGTGLISNIRVEGDFPGKTTARALIGLHWGPSILALEMFRRAGLQPRFVHRQVGREIMRAAPFQYLFLRMLVVAINKACCGGAITVPGAKADLEDALSGTGTPVLLMDAPPVSERRTINVKFLERNVQLAADGMDLLAARHTTCAFYAMGLAPGGAGKTLEVTRTIVADDRSSLAALVAEHYNRFVLRDSAQWRLWHAAGQLFELDEST